MNEPSPAAPADPRAIPRFCLLWRCPRCERAWTAADHVLPDDRIDARLLLSSGPLTCGRCGTTWEAWEVGIHWQPENDAARAQIQQGHG